MHKSVSSTTAVMRHHVLTDAILFGPFAGKTISEPVAKAFLIVVGSLLLAVSAQIKIPFYPVPVTGQTLVVLLIGMTYGCLLYTSPSPRDRTRSRMPSSA